jgi:hypothetical protein
MIAPQILNVRYGLRNRLKNTAHHNSESSIPAADVTPEKEPEIHTIIKTLATEIAANPALILTDTYTGEERAADWKALVARPTTLTGLDSRSRPGHKLLDHHMPHFWDVRNFKGVSVRSMCTPQALEKALHANLRMHSTPYKSEIRRTLVMTAGLGNVTKYRALTTKAIVEALGPKRSGPKDTPVPAVLDPCAGWGGRMLGVLAAGGTYVAAEPDPRTYYGLVNILEDDAIPRSVAERATIHNAPAELVLPTLRPASFDIVLTSPPYFNLELYGEAGAQSTSTHPSWEGWVAHWLRPVIVAALAALKPTGVSCWSVKNFRSDRTYPLADVVKQIHADAGWKLTETVCVSGSGRPGAARIQDGKETRGSEEETYCFRVAVGAAAKIETRTQ